MSSPAANDQLTTKQPTASSHQAPQPTHPTAYPSATALLVRRDSKAWQLQTWISFALAVALCATGLAYLPGQDLDRAFMFMGYLFCLSTAFVLSKLVRDAEGAANHLQGAAASLPGHTTSPTGQPGDASLFRLVVWASFALAIGLTAWGLVRMQVNPTYKVVLGVAWLYLISSAFTLAKMLRDRQEADALHAQLHARPNHELLAHSHSAASTAAAQQA